MNFVYNQDLREREMVTGKQNIRNNLFPEIIHFHNNDLYPVSRPSVQDARTTPVNNWVGTINTTPNPSSMGKYPPSFFRLDFREYRIV